MLSKYIFLETGLHPLQDAVYIVQIVLDMHVQGMLEMDGCLDTGGNLSHTSISNLFPKIEQRLMFKMVPNMNEFVKRLLKNWTMLRTFQGPLVKIHKTFGLHNGYQTQSLHHSENTKIKLITMMKQRRVLFAWTFTVYIT